MFSNTKIRAVFKWLLSTVRSSLIKFKSAYLPQKWRNKKKQVKKSLISHKNKL